MGTTIWGEKGAVKVGNRAKKIDIKEGCFGQLFGAFVGI